MGNTLKYVPSEAFSCQRHYCTTLTRNWVVALIIVVFFLVIAALLCRLNHCAEWVVKSRELRELSEFREFSE